MNCVCIAKNDKAKRQIYLVFLSLLNFWRKPCHNVFFAISIACRFSITLRTKQASRKFVYFIIHSIRIAGIYFLLQTVKICHFSCAPLIIFEKPQLAIDQNGGEIYLIVFFLFHFHFKSSYYVLHYHTKFHHFLLYNYKSYNEFCQLVYLLRF